MTLPLEEVQPGSFIYRIRHALDEKNCNEMIAQFENSTEQQYVGRIGQQADRASDIKRSTDLRISGRKDWQSFDQLLQASLSDALGMLSGLHPFFQSNPLHDIGYNLQRTESGEFYHWHIDGGAGEFSKRQLVAIWYLSSPPAKGGNTDFYFQNISIKPEQGMLILFPPFWTHLHRGDAVVQGSKYIATTWVCVD